MTNFTVLKRGGLGLSVTGRMHREARYAGSNQCRAPERRAEGSVAECSRSWGLPASGFAAFNSCLIYVSRRCRHDVHRRHNTPRAYDKGLCRKRASGYSAAYGKRKHPEASRFYGQFKYARAGNRFYRFLLTGEASA